MNNIEILRACTEHTDAIARIEQICFSVPWSAKSVREFLENDLSICFVAICGTAVVGYIGMYNVCGCGDITNIAVLPEYRRRGIAGDLLYEMENCACKLSLNEISLEVRASNSPAISLYSKHGFERVGQRKDYYTKPKEDAVLMTKFYQTAEN